MMKVNWVGNWCTWMVYWS